MRKTSETDLEGRGGKKSRVCEIQNTVGSSQIKGTSTIYTRIRSRTGNMRRKNTCLLYTEGRVRTKARGGRKEEVSRN